MQTAREYYEIKKLFILSTAHAMITDGSNTMTDTYLLFSEFPYDFQTYLPLPVGCGVSLASSDEPQRIIREAEDTEGLRAMLIPEQVIGAGHVHVCLHRSHGISRSTRQATGDLWRGLLAMRLALPFGFRSSGTLTFDGERVTSISRNYLCSAANPPGVRSFGRTAVKRAAQINRRMGKLRGTGLERARSALTLFSHVTLGMVSSWQLAMMGLFGNLECIFPQPSRRHTPGLTHPNENYGQRLGRRVSTFLPRDLQSPNLQQFVERVYRERRNPLAHGFHIVPVRNLTRMKANAELFLKLHEAARLTLLGLLGMSNATLRSVFPKNAGDVAAQNRIDSLGRAPLTFLYGQKFWPTREQ